MAWSHVGDAPASDWLFQPTSCDHYTCPPLIGCPSSRDQEPGCFLRTPMLNECRPQGAGAYINLMQAPSLDADEAVC